MLLIVPLGLSEPVWLWLSVGAMLGLFINPDLDQNGLSAAETIFMKLPTAILKGAGITLMGQWISIWGFYAALLPHRSPLSHWPVIGTVGRVVYLLGVVWLVSKVFGDGQAVSVIVATPAVWIAVVGLGFADLGHWLRDIGVLKFSQEKKDKG